MKVRHSFFLIAVLFLTACQQTQVPTAYKQLQRGLCPL